MLLQWTFVSWMEGKKGPVSSISAFIFNVLFFARTYSLFVHAIIHLVFSPERISIIFCLQFLLSDLLCKLLGKQTRRIMGDVQITNRIICTRRPSRKLRMTWYLSLKPCANGRIIVAQKHVASVCTPCCMLIACCWRCCVKFETGQSFSYGKVKETQHLPPLLGQQCWELLNTFASGFSPKLSSDIVDVMKIYRDTRK